MQTRKERYAKYREEIAHTPDELFPDSPRKIDRLSPEDEELLRQADSAGSSIGYGEIIAQAKKRNAGDNSLTPYERYLKRRRTVFLIKLIAFFLTVVALILLYTLWVR
ncbi:MAG: hypothetical protein Q4F15_02955 [Bacillota bacterium]|nr:hypothetical protein [Bacillota bacterium]